MTPHKDVYYMMSSPSYREVDCPLMWEYRVGEVSRLDLCEIMDNVYFDPRIRLDYVRKI